MRETIFLRSRKTSRKPLIIVDFLILNPKECCLPPMFEKLKTSESWQGDYLAQPLARFDQSIILGMHVSPIFFGISQISTDVMPFHQIGNNEK